MSERVAQNLIAVSRRLVPQAAVVSFQNMLKNFPGSKEEEKAKLLLVKSSYTLAEKSVAHKRAERYEESKKLAVKYSKRITNRTYLKEIKSILKNIDKKLNTKA